MAIKKRKFALSLKIASLLSCIAILSVGFASWLVIRPVEDQIHQGTVTTATVSDENLTLEFAEADNAEIHFGYSNRETTANDWLVPGGNDLKPADLLVTFDFTVTDTTTNQADYTITVNLASIVAEGKNAEAFQGLIDAGILGTPEVMIANQAKDAIGTPTIIKEGLYNQDITFTKAELKAAAALDTGAVTTETVAGGIKYNLVISIQFKWGSLTEAQNPYTYYNGFAWNASTDPDNDATYDANLNAYKTYTVAYEIATNLLKDLNDTVKTNTIAYKLTASGKVVKAQ
ncbi:MAG: hypothetical protein IJW13_04520 [Clostridia bacterium]|nr:hypothetical protein [Clostridia bacterium]